MPWGAPVAYDPFAEDAPVAPKRSTWDAVKSAFTGEGRTEFPDAPEFAGAYRQSQPDEVTQAAIMAWAGGGGFQPETTPEQDLSRDAYMQGMEATANSNITPDPEAQYDILAKAIPGLERKADSHGNVMLKAPGMTDFAYLNKPGMSTRDLTEFGLQTAATAPITALAAPVAGAGLLMNIGRGALGLATSSVAQDVAAGALGSDQGVDTGRALISGGIGGALPALGAAARTVVGAASGTYNGVRGAVRGVADPKGVAREEVQAAFQRDFDNGGLTAKDALQPSDAPAMAMRGQDSRVADFGGQNVRAQARKAANFSDSANDEIMRAVGPRFESQASRTADFVEKEMGFGGSALQARTALDDAARKARAPLYRQAYAAGKDGIDSPLLQQLQQSPTFQRAMGSAEHRVADQAATPGWVSTGVRGKNGFTLEYWDQVKQALDDYAGQAMRKGAKSKGAQLTQMAKALRTELDNQGQAGKLYGQARGTALQYFKADNALEAGEAFAKGSFNFQDAAHAVGSLNAPEKRLFAEGYADNFVRTIRATPDRSSVLNRIMNSPQEQERVKIALGQGKFDQLEGFLRLEGIMDRLRTAQGNSTTARQARQMMQTYGVQTVGGGVGVLGAMQEDPKMMILGAIMAGGRAAQLRINSHVAEEIAHLLTSKDPDVFLKGLHAVGKAPINTAIRAFDNLLADAGQAVPIAVQGGVNARSYQTEGR